MASKFFCRASRDPTSAAPPRSPPPPPAPTAAAACTGGGASLGSGPLRARRISWRRPRRAMAARSGRCARLTHRAKSETHAPPVPAACAALNLGAASAPAESADSSAAAAGSFGGAAIQATVAWALARGPARRLAASIARPRWRSAGAVAGVTSARQRASTRPHSLAAPSAARERAFPALAPLAVAVRTRRTSESHPAGKPAWGAPGGGLGRPAETTAESTPPGFPALEPEALAAARNESKREYEG
mmetsp:Transcript_27806/g.62072  ORF Transcript_27806/g.62072 Transcript_27806/m.62072 type:complete len:246 (-) Transcript_27806:1226-1963(-)